MVAGDFVDIYGGDTHRQAFDAVPSPPLTSRHGARVGPAGCTGAARLVPATWLYWPRLAQTGPVLCCTGADWPRAGWTGPA